MTLNENSVFCRLSGWSALDEKMIWKEIFKQMESYFLNRIFWLAKKEFYFVELCLDWMPSSKIIFVQKYINKIAQNIVFVEEQARLTTFVVCMYVHTDKEKYS